ncbi:type II toxin-antitoxin system PemK/MazF family toxin [Streptomyces sp. NPDC100445]|uniref:type II toxin-antitoxin system PemK/MazF family toxin n=1 Tax=Streptomyces sp. NPDC100445 TaxID=3366102 RepID=UPI00381A23FB
MRETVGRYGDAAYAFLGVALLVAWLPLTGLTGVVLFVLGYRKEFQDDGGFGFSDALELVVVLLIALGIAYARARTRAEGPARLPATPGAARTVSARAGKGGSVRVQGWLVAAECLGGGLIAAATGADLVASAMTGAGVSLLITGLLLGSWIRTLPRPAPAPPRRGTGWGPGSPPRGGAGSGFVRRPRRPASAPRQGSESVPPDPGLFRGRPPAPGDVWFAELPFDGGTSSKDRPCLVVRTFRRHAQVLKITSANKSGRPDYVRMPVAAWDPTAVHDSWLESAPLRELPYTAFRRLAGPCDTGVWEQVRRRHGLC